MLPQAINFKAALTAYCPRLDLRKLDMWSFLVFGLTRTLPTASDFDLRRYAVPPRLKEMLLSLENRHCMPTYFEDEDYQIGLLTLDSNN
jgi:hypothetical protein